MEKIILVLGVGIAVFVGLFIYGIITDEPPHFFPLNDMHAQYMITKNCPNGQGWIEQNHAQGEAYCMTYRGNNVLMKEEHGNGKFFSITIGKSNIDLESYVGKQVKNIKGKYTSSSQQCIQNKCSYVGGPFVVIDIESLEAAK